MVKRDFRLMKIFTYCFLLSFLSCQALVAHRNKSDDPQQNTPSHDPAGSPGTDPKTDGLKDLAYKDVKTIFDENCNNCHGKTPGLLSLSSLESIKKNREFIIGVLGEKVTNQGKRYCEYKFGNYSQMPPRTTPHCEQLYSNADNPNADFSKCFCHTENWEKLNTWLKNGTDLGERGVPLIPLPSNSLHEIPKAPDTPLRFSDVDLIAKASCGGAYCHAFVSDREPDRNLERDRYTCHGPYGGGMPPITLNWIKFCGKENYGRSIASGYMPGGNHDTVNGGDSLFGLTEEGQKLMQWFYYGEDLK